MNQDVFEEKLEEMRGQVKEWWGKITDDDLERRQIRSTRRNPATEARLLESKSREGTERQIGSHPGSLKLDN